MNIAKIEENVQSLISSYSKKTFIYDLLLAYGQPKSAITRLQQGTYNLSKKEGEVLWKKKVFFKVHKTGDLHELIDETSKDLSIRKQDPRFLIVTDFETLLALDTKTLTTLDIEFKRLNKHFDFFLPLGGLEKVSVHIENPADVKAAEKMAKLYDQIKKDNTNSNEKRLHEQNVFLSRLLFCYFAEDTEIFKKGQFTSSLASHTNPDGSDLNTYLDRLFDVMNTKDRKKYPSYLQEFPYVNGGLLSTKIKSPNFTAKSRKLLLECGELNWSEINPDIFGSMIQAVVHPSQRGGLGMHYTSVPNIMKAMKPLFLDELYETFHAAKGSLSKLEKLLERIYRLKFFDPACGSGNFLIIAYKELRKLEMLIIKEKSLLKKQISFQYSSVSISQFYGIEVDDFAHEIAILSLWLAEHQMNLQFKNEFGDVHPTLPLKIMNGIVHANALEIDWNHVCPKEKNEEVIIFGNPPYLGGKFQTKKQKEEMGNVFNGIKNFGELDYIAAWFYKASIYVKDSISKFGFVTTSSISQGSQVHQLWPHIFKKNLEIYFAYKPFPWANSAKANAAVTCTIIGIGPAKNVKKLIFENDQALSVKNISPYLIQGSNRIIYQRLKPLSDLPPMITGNSAYDGGNLLLSREQKDSIVDSAPETISLFKRICGSQDFLSGEERWCLWVAEENLDLALSCSEIKRRIDATKQFRSKGGEVAKGLVKRPYQFRYTHTAKKSLIIIPRVSSMRRNYIPFGFLDSNFIVSDAAQAIYDPEPFVFGILSSKMHMLWVQTLAGRLKTDYRYSSGICYNTFPIPELSEKNKQAITSNVLNILSEREKHSSEPLGKIYDPDKMPTDLKKAHESLDEVVDKCYRSTQFKSDEQRLEALFSLYDEQISRDAEDLENA